ncbi:putative 2OG-Fe(II) oxygenase [Sphingomonas sp. MMS24-JH45]
MVGAAGGRRAQRAARPPDGLAQFRLLRRAARCGRRGELALGTPPPELGLDLAPYHSVSPRVGRLVLFPSTMWHATTPFAAGERLNIAFDVLPAA